MFMNNKMANSVRIALAFGAVSTAAFTANSAVAAEEDAAKKVERIEVTGSRLKRTDLETATPVTTVTGEEMKAMGIQDVGQFMQSSPIMSGSPAMTTTNNGGNGGTFVELRGLGSERTLVLINGRRVVSSDFQGIPSSMIERIEVLKDGASATYGADAVAGVVNIITKKNFEGVEVTAMQKAYFDVDSSGQNSFNIVAGKTFSDGSFLVGLDYVKEKPITQGDVKNVEFFQAPYLVDSVEGVKSFIANGLITSGPDANAFIYGSGSTPCGNFTVAGRPGSWTNGNCPAKGTDGKPADADMRRFVGGGANNDTYNYNPINLMQTPYTKVNFFVEGNFQLNDSTNIYSETRINKRESNQELAETPYDTQFDPGFLLPNGRNGVSKDNYYNPFGADVNRSRRRMVEAGRTFEQDVTRFQQVFGISGENTLVDGWTYDVSSNYAYSQTTSIDRGQLFGPNLGKALGPSFKDATGKIVCGTPGAVIDGCVPLNVFGGPGTITKEMLDYISAPLLDADNSDLLQVTAFTGGDLFELPGGIVAGGFGVEYLKETFEQERDSGKFLSVVSGNKGKVLQQGEYDNTSVFAEFEIPLLPESDFVKRMDLKVGARHDDFSHVGTADTYQVGLVWEVVDGLMLRSNYGTVFRSPTLVDLYGPAADSFPQAVDPCSTSTWATAVQATRDRCLAAGVPAGGSPNLDTQQLAKVGGNANVKPEEGDTFTAGVAYSPDFIEGLGLTVDYWEVNIEGSIDSISAGDSLQGCYVGGIQRLCDNVVRDNTGYISYVKGLTQNLFEKNAKGIDTEVSYSLDTEIGRFNFNTVWTHFLQREDEKYSGATSTFELSDLSGRFVDDTSYATDKASFSVSYDWEDLNIVYRATYVGALEYNAADFQWGFDPAEVEGLVAKVDTYLYHDISATYNFSTNTIVSVGIDNVTDELPPYIENAFNGNTDESTYRLFGRGYFVKFTQKF
jgi:outer membrane receptor protein involved in Fe transport